MQGRGKKVGPRGNRSASIAIVGEGPGRQEVRFGEPFRGMAGNYLERWCKSVGIEIEDCFLTNTTKYKPPSQNRDKFFFEGKKISDVYLEGIKELKEELEEVRPNVVVALGNYALWALTQNWGITKWRGSILRCTIAQDMKVVPTIHPAAIMRGRWTDFPLVIWDLKRAKEESKSRKLKLPKRNLITFPEAHEVEIWRQKLLEAKKFSFDTEWSDSDTLKCLSFSITPGEAISIPANVPGFIPFLEEVLGSDAHKIMQNAMFDVTYTERIGIPVKIQDSEGNLLVEDTMVKQAVCWPDLKKDLGTICSIYTREPYYKDDLKIWGETQDDKTLYVYNAKDSAVTLESNIELESELDSTRTRKAYELDMLCFPVMVRAHLRGVCADVKKLFELKKTYLERAKEIQKTLNSAIGLEINVRSHKQVASVVYDTLGVKRTNRSTKQEILMDIAALTKKEDVKTVLAAIISIRKNLNIVSKYINESLIDSKDGRLRCNWNVCGTPTGRMSATKDKFRGTGASHQTIPSKARSIFVADPGYTMLVYDFEQAEARVVAYKSHDDLLTSWFNEGADIHKKLTEVLFGIPYEKVKKPSRERYLCKQTRHATNYGEGPRTFKLSVNKHWIDTGIGITQSQATMLMSKIKQVHPSILEYQKWVENCLAYDKRTITNPFGRSRRFIGQLNQQLFKKAYAQYPQSTIADLNHTVMHRIDQTLGKSLGVEILIDTHDGCVMQVPTKNFSEAVKLLGELLIYPITIDGREVVIPFELSSGPSWAEQEVLERTK